MNSQHSDPKNRLLEVYRQPVTTLLIVIRSFHFILRYVGIPSCSSTPTNGSVHGLLGDKGDSFGHNPRHLCTPRNFCPTDLLCLKNGGQRLEVFLVEIVELDQIFNPKMTGENMG